MRYARFLLPMFIAVIAAASAGAQSPQYVTDPSTGRSVPVVQQYAQPGYGSYGQQPYYAQGRYAQSYVAQQPRYAQPQQSGGRGLFNFNGRPQTYTYQPQYQAQPRYSYQPQYGQQSYRYGQQGYAAQQPRQSYVLQYHQPQQQQPQAGSPYGYGYGSAYAYAPAAQGYTLDAGDKLRIVVFGQTGISGDYLVDASGQVTLPLVGSVPARGRTTKALEGMIAERLKQGYVRDPHVTVSIASYRPFFILGEVTTPGQYPYVPNMTAENAVAIAGGFSPRAKKSYVELTRNWGGQQIHQRVPLGYPLQPGDTVVVKERWF
jgi:polysaccharide export outer membrane protein